MEKLLSFLPKIERYLLNYIKAQLVVTLVSLPILISSGLPISIMSVVGNLLFIPLITAFLIVSSMLFFTELLYIPNGYIASALDLITSTFEYLLNLGKKEWLFGFMKVNPIFLIPIPVITLLIIRYKKHSFTLLFFTLFITCTSLMLIPKATVLSHNNLLITMNNNQVDIVDSGEFSKKTSPENFVNFTLKPDIIKNFGLININTIILKKPGVRTFKAICELAKTFHINNVIVEIKKTKLSKYAWKCYFDLKSVVEDNGGKLIKKGKV